MNTPIRTLGDTDTPPDKKTTECLSKLNAQIDRLHDLHLVHQDITGHLPSEHPVSDISTRVHDKMASDLESQIEKILVKLYTKQLNSVQHNTEETHA